jgi:peptide/nickel transport system permease protein
MGMRMLVKHAIRILLLLVVGGFLGATLVRFAPGFGVDEEDLDSRLSATSHAQLRGSRVLDGGLANFYFDYWKRLLHGDLGESATFHEPVRQLLVERIPETAKSLAVGLAVAWPLGLGLALASVTRPTRYAGAGATLLSNLILCIPAAVLAILFVLVQAPGRVAVGVIVFPKVFQFARNLLVRCASMPHVLAARARGLGEVRILLWHILPIAATQILALFGVSICMALAASIPVEALCDLPGIGQLAWKAALGRDLELLVILTMIVTFVTLVANSGMELLASGMRREGA